MRRSLKRTVGVCLGLLLSLQATAQRWGGGVDEDPLHFGFLFQYINAGYKVKLNENWREPSGLSTPFDSLMSVTSPVSHGWGLGLLADARLYQRINLRFSPTLIFSNRNMFYYYGAEMRRVPKGNQQSLVGDAGFLQSPIFDFPLSLRYTSDRKSNYKIHVMVGGKYSFEVVPEKEEPGTLPFAMILRTKRSYFSYEAGLGMELYLEYFKMTPEIKFSQSLHNVLGRPYQAPNPYHSPIDKLFLRSFQFSLFFE